MQVILLEKVKNLGALGDMVSVKPGYGRNFLIPQNKAVFATAKNIELFESRRAELEEKAVKGFAKAQERAAKLADMTLVVASQASDEGKLYGSVGIPEIKEAFAAKNMDVSKREIILSEGVFHSIGRYEINIQVHSDLLVPVQLEVVASK